MIFDTYLWECPIILIWMLQYLMFGMKRLVRGTIDKFPITLHNYAQVLRNKDKFVFFVSFWCLLNYFNFLCSDDVNLLIWAARCLKHKEFFFYKVMSGIRGAGKLWRNVLLLGPQVPVIPHNYRILVRCSQSCGSKYFEFGSGSRVILSVLKEKIKSVYF